MHKVLRFVEKVKLNWIADFNLYKQIYNSCVTPAVNKGCSVMVTAVWVLAQSSKFELNN